SPRIRKSCVACGAWSERRDGPRPTPALRTVPHASAKLSPPPISGGLMVRQVLVGISLLALCAVMVVAQAPDIPESGSVEAIAAATTDPHYVSPWVSYVPQSRTVPSPEKFL